MTQEIAEPAKSSNIIQVEVFTGDIAELPVQAIASVITPDLDIQGRLNNAIFSKAGPDLDNYILDNIIEPKEGQTFFLPGFDLPATNFIMGIMPHWRSDLDVVDKHLVRAVKGIVETACRNNVTELAIPVLCSGRGGYPKARAIRLILQTVQETIFPPLQKICFVCETKDVLELYRRRLRAE